MNQRFERELASDDAKLAAELLIREKHAIDFLVETEVKFRELALNAEKNPAACKMVATGAADIVKQTREGCQLELERYLLRLAGMKPQ